MATNRFQFSDDFVLKNGKVGINTAEPQEKLEVLGTIIADNIRATDISNLHTYEGFINQNHNIDENLTLSLDTTTSLSSEIIVGDDATVTIGSEATSSQGNIDSLKVYNTFTVPTGGTEDRPRKVKPGQLYYNVDFKTIEFWDGNNWRQVDNTTRSGRGVFGGGTADTDLIQYINISTTGNAINFGNLFESGYGIGAVSSSTRGVWGGRTFPSISDTMDYVTLASEGNAIDFGNLTGVKRFYGTAASSTRGLFIAGTNPSATNVIDYIEINTIGNALDFGDCSLSFMGNNNGLFCSPTKGFVCSGPTDSRIDSITISSKGDSIDFGDTSARGQMETCSNSVRGILAGGFVLTPSAVTVNIIEYISLSSGGNAQEFGQLTLPGWDSTSAASNIRGVFSGRSTPSSSNVIDYVTIMTAGNAIDFGDLSANQQAGGGCSDSHGGLGGF